MKSLIFNSEINSSSSLPLKVMEDLLQSGAMLDAKEGVVSKARVVLVHVELIVL